jgi:hypothetical protein
MERTTPLARLFAVMFCVGSLVLPCSPAQRKAQSFDNAIRESVVDLGISPYYADSSKRHGQLRCHYFPTFLVKELDWGQEGDDWISIARNDPAHLAPCNQESRPAEAFHRKGDEYFDGVNGSYVFLGAADCFDRGCPFRVLDAASGSELFKDQTRLSPKGIIAGIQFLKRGDHLVMRYPTIFAAECSLLQKESECWNQILSSTGLKVQPAPKCIGYSGFNRKEGYGTDDLSDPSVVSFEVEVTIPGFKRQILPGPVSCWAAD